MCFKISEKHPNLKIANKDIVCYKRFGTNYVSTVGYYKKYFIWWGSRNKSETIHKKTKLGIPNAFNDIHEGFHSYSNKKGLRRNNYNCYECLIPKGSEYYYNPKQMTYVSNELIVLKNKNVNIRIYL